MSGITCDTKEMSVEQIARNLVAKDTNGNAAIRVVNSVDSGDSYFDCDVKNVTMEQLFRAITTVDGNGKLALNLAMLP
ncbi:MAG: hypothetical protein KC589_09370 [Nanoarchaeota archaeon]|nr:hypothetical protein [Nanoarchaeota archaeon]